MYERGFVWNKDTKSWDKKVANRLPHPIPEPDSGSRVAKKDKDEIPGRASRVTLTITSFRCRLLDVDNLAGGCKFLIDALRYNRVIDGDSPDHIELIIRQVKVDHRCDELTEVEITPITLTAAVVSQTTGENPGIQSSVPCSP